VRAEDKEGVKNELTETKETTDIRIKALERQEKQLVEKYQELQTELSQAISAAKQTGGGT
jgi:chaperonin cofactor prefoldin